MSTFVVSEANAGWFMRLPDHPDWYVHPDSPVLDVNGHALTPPAPKRRGDLTANPSEQDLADAQIALAQRIKAEVSMGANVE